MQAHPLPWRQDELRQRGHAIEARIYAEDSARGDLPQAGPLLLYREPVDARHPGGFRRRVKADEVTVHYDPMLAKLIAFGRDAGGGLRPRPRGAAAYPILGIRTNIPLLLALLDHPRFVAGTVDTHFLDSARDELLPAAAAEPSAEARAIDAAVRAAGGSRTSGSAGTGAADPWDTLRGARA